MSLIHWWSLNGNLKDYGLKQSNLSSSGTTTNANGKIGKCYKLTDSNKITGAINDFNYANTSISMGGWFKFNKAEISSVLTSSIVTSTAKAPTGNLIGNNNYGGFGLVWEANDIYTSGSFSSLRVYPYLRRSSQSIYLTTSAFTVTFDTWYHFMVTLDIVNRKVSFYVNGTLHSSGTYNVAIEYESHEYYLNVGWVGGGNGPGKSIPFYVNDVRMYDHALSVKEVKEISKGLVLHYTFEDGYIEGTTNRVNISSPSSTCYNGVTSTYGWGSNTNMQKTMGTFHDKYGMKVSSITAGSSTYPYVFFDNLNPYSTTENTYSTFSFDYYTTSQTILVPYSYYSGVSIKSKLNGVDMGGATISGIKLNTWNHIEITYQRTTNDYQGSGCGYIRIGSTSHTSTTSDYWIFANLQSEYKDHATPFVNGTRPNGLIYDNSGYGYNGTPTGAIEIISGNVSGNHVINFPATSCYIKLPAFGMSGFANSYTFSWWSKITDMSGRMAWGFGDGNRLNLYPSGAFCWNTGDGGNNKFQNNGTAVSFTPYNNAWHLYTITGDGTTTKLYIDGEYKGSATTYKAITGTQIYISGWDTSTSYKWLGQIADFKIYATTLSASDILAEYNRKASIDRSGNLFTGEFVEINDNTNITKTDIIKSSYFEEGTSLVKMVDGYTELEYIQSDSSGYAYINTLCPIYSGDSWRVEMELMMGNTWFSGYQSIFNSTLDSDTFECWINNTSNKGNLNVRYNGTALRDIIQFEPGNKYRVIFNYSNTTLNAYVNDVLKKTTTIAKTTRDVSSVYLTIGHSVDATTFKYYNVKLYKDSVLLRNFIPAKRNSDSAIGMYDTVNRKFYTNAGSGSFTAGPEKGDLSIVYSKQIIEN